MKKEFDHFLKIKLDTLDNLPGISFDEEKIWKKIKPRIHKGSRGKFYTLIGLSITILITIGIFSYLRTTNIKAKTEVKIISKPIQEVSPQDEKVNLDTESKIKNKPLLRNKTPISKNIKIEKATDTFKVRVKEIKVPKFEYSPDEKRTAKKDTSDKVNFLIREKQMAFVHLYRPSNIVGSVSVLNLKANGKKIAKIRNGKHMILELKPGPTQFSIGRKTVTTILKSGEIYYLRASFKGFPVGRPALEEVSKSSAKVELEKN